MNKQMQQKIQNFMDQGVIFKDLNNVFIGENVSIGKNTVIYPGVYLDNNVVIGQNCTIQNSTMIIENVKIFDDVFIGPFSLIRDQISIGTKSSIGPHCELTRSTLGTQCKIGHKNFIGDAILMDGVKFGAGAIIANSNWSQTFKTIIGENSLVGVNAVIIAPVKIGKDSLIAAGSTITKDVGDYELAIARSYQENKPRKK